jgi:hypothetical protein
MDEARRAFVEVLVARAAWRAASDAEAQVAHWLTEGLASAADLAHRREMTRRARQAHQRATRRYNAARANAMVAGRGHGDARAAAVANVAG